MKLLEYLQSHGIKPIDDETLQESIPRISNKTIGTNDDLQLRSFHIDSSGIGEQLKDKEID